MEHTIMPEMIEMFTIIMLAVLTFIDLKYKRLPSLLTTSFLFIVAIVNIQNLPYGILAFIFGWMMLEGLTDKGEFFSGIADLKITIILGFLVTSLFGLLLTIMLIVVYGVVYKYGLKEVRTREKEVAFIPVFLFVYLTLLIIQRVGGIVI